MKINCQKQVSGRINAPTKKTDWFGHPTDTWLSFYMVNGLTVSGSGLIDGRGPIWWQNACIGTVSNLVLIRSVM